MVPLDAGLAGPLVLVDISGYTTYVAETELTRSQILVAELLDGVLQSLGAHPEVSKVIAHHGQYSRFRVGQVEQLHGTDVIVLHRLAKNHIPSHEYILATTAFLERLLPEQAADFIRVEEPITDLGVLSVGYRDFASLRAQLQ
jgi:hypothetical protein